MSRLWANDDYDYFEDAVNSAVRSGSSSNHNSSSSYNNSSSSSNRKRTRQQQQRNDDTSSDESADSDWDERQEREYNTRTRYELVGNHV